MTALSPRIAAFADRWPKLFALTLGAVSATGFAPLNFWPLTLLALAGCTDALQSAANDASAAEAQLAAGNLDEARQSIRRAIAVAKR